MLLRALLLCAGIFSMSAAHAEFMHTDWKTSGDGLATLHEETGLEWLKVTETTGLSVNQVLAQTGQGGAYEGFRLPTLEELDHWWMSIFSGSSVTNNPPGSVRQYSGLTPMASDWLALNGTQTTDPWRSYGIGTTWDGDYGFWGLSYASGTSKYRYGASAYDANYANVYMGVFLVSDGGDTLSSQLDPTLNINNPDAPINNVPALAIGGLALLGLGLRRKRHA